MVSEELLMYDKIVSPPFYLSSTCSNVAMHVYLHADYEKCTGVDQVKLYQTVQG